MVGYGKIESSCSIAAACGYNYIWIDTCCIDKTSSAELSEAITPCFTGIEKQKCALRT